MDIGAVDAAIGADEVESIMSALGVHGRHGGGHGVAMQRIVPNPQMGRVRCWPMMFNTAAPAAAATWTLQSQADRDAVLTKLFLFGSVESDYSNAAAGTVSTYKDNKALLFLQSLNVGGRNSLVGSGSAAFRAFDKDSFWMPKLGVCNNGNFVNIGGVNSSSQTQTVSAVGVAQTVD